MDGATLSVILLGLLHGLNPAQGWLFAVFMGIHRKRVWHIPATVGVISASHIASVALVVGLQLIALSLWGPMPLVLGAALLAYGGYRLLKGFRHRPTALNIGYMQLALWGFLAGFSHGSGLMLLPFVTQSSALPLGLLHWSATAVTMLTMALLTTYVLTLSVLRKIWINFDLLWSVVLVIIGGAMFLTSVAAVLGPAGPAGHVHPGPSP